MKKYYYITLLALVAMVTSCSSIDCELDGKIQCHYAFVNQDDEAVQLAYPLTVTLLRKMVDTDSVFINQQDKVNAMDIPMSYLAETDSIALTLTIDENTSVSDTMRLTKSNKEVFESVDCPARYQHEITYVSSTHNFIDTLIINNPKVSNNASVKNILIRVHTN